MLVGKATKDWKLSRCISPLLIVRVNSVAGEINFASLKQAIAVGFQDILGFVSNDFLLIQNTFRVI